MSDYSLLSIISCSHQYGGNFVEQFDMFVFYSITYIQHANYSIQCFLFFLVKYSQFLFVNRGTCWSKNNLKKKKIHSSCLSNYIFPLDTVSDHVSLNYFCDHTCITCYIFIKVLNHALL